MIRTSWRRVVQEITIELRSQESIKPGKGFYFNKDPQKKFQSPRGDWNRRAIPNLILYL